MVTNTLTKTDDLVAFDDYLRFGTDDERPNIPPNLPNFQPTPQFFSNLSGSVVSAACSIIGPPTPHFPLWNGSLGS